jgi:PAS domain S-box-containing protein
LDGELIPCEVTLIRVQRDGEHAIAVYIQDLREQKAAIAKMREADERVRLILDSTPLSCSLVDRELNIIETNKETVNFFKLKDRSEFKERFMEFFPARQPDGRESAKRSRELVDLAFANGYSRSEWVHQSADGEMISCEVILVRVKYRDDFVVAVYIRDLRDQEAMIARMRESDEHMRILLDSAPMSCTLWGEDFNIIGCNQETANLFGLLDKETYKDRFFELSPKYQPNGKKSADMVREIFEIAFEDGYHRCEWMHQTLQGDPIPCEVIVARVMYRGEYVLASYIRDLRERKAPFMDIMLEMEERARRMPGSPSVNCSMIWEADELQGLVGFIGKLEEHLKGILSKKSDNCEQVCLRGSNDIGNCRMRHETEAEMDKVMAGESGAKAD